MKLFKHSNIKQMIKSFDYIILNMFSVFYRNAYYFVFFMNNYKKILSLICIYYKFYNVIVINLELFFYILILSIIQSRINKLSSEFTRKNKNKEFQTPNSMFVK
ncbi:hypothetical protein EDEG_02126 [Edhazardia aedis USNM 41457]|uniref:Uncharacterized protein n=1 Tax=Edhazardia aedis (strain USNM 41457) TaxID=1003232 RepID=J9DQF2_EDHAE|nr:hypothetical protein EDEG_02126 [Edhazardia aedis USNM 41457]|eukprot:EJW03542.1 hypothetical protein EDEG_02126 [Edhazardia aedis USNM 41457]